MVRIWFYSLCSVGLVGCVAGGERLEGSENISEVASRLLSQISS